MNSEILYPKNLKEYRYFKKLDDSRRLYVPPVLLNKIDAKIGDIFSVTFDGTSIIYTKFEYKCIFCGTRKHIERFKNKKICRKCLNAMRHDIETLYGDILIDQKGDV